MKDQINERQNSLNRRAFLSKSAIGIGSAALASLLGYRFFSTSKNGVITDVGNGSGLGDLPHFAPKAKRVIYLFQSGGLRSWICLITNPC